jgi:hypothetical protein
VEFSIEQIDPDSLSGEARKPTMGYSREERERKKNRRATAPFNALGVPAPIIFLSRSVELNPGCGSVLFCTYNRRRIASSVQADFAKCFRYPV